MENNNIQLRKKQFKNRKMKIADKLRSGRRSTSDTEANQ